METMQWVQKATSVRNNIFTASCENQWILKKCKVAKNDPATKNVPLSERNLPSSLPI